jgi:hypothetical protein
MRPWFSAEAAACAAGGAGCGSAGPAAAINPAASNQGNKG